MATANLTAVVSTKGATRANSELKNLAKNSKKVETNVIRAEGKFKSFGKNSAAAIASIDGPLGGVSSRVSSLTTLLTVGGASMTAFALAVTAGSAALIQGIGNLDDYDVNLRRVNATIKATGEGVGFTGEALQKEAEAIALATLTSVDAVQKAQAKLLTFNRVLGSEFSRSIKLSQDLAEAGFGSIESNAILLGKALQDPIKGMSALSRVGVTLSETQKQLAEDAVNVGDVFTAQEIILNAVAGQVEGVAAAVANGTLAGAIDTLGQNWDELTRNVAESSGALTTWTQIVNGAAITAKIIADTLAGPTSDELFTTALNSSIELAAAEEKLQTILDNKTLGYQRQKQLVDELTIANTEAVAAASAAAEAQNKQITANGIALEKERAARISINAEVKAEAEAALQVELERTKAKEDRAAAIAEREIERTKKTNARQIELAKSKEEQIAKDKARLEKQTRRDRQSALDQTQSDLASALGEENALFKAAAITNTTIKTYESATSAYSALASIPVVGPALGAAAAGAAVAAGLVNVAKISSAREQGGSLSAGQSSTVAERGQLEILTPSSSSRIRTKQQMQQLMGGESNSQPTINIVNIDQSSGGVQIETSTDDDGRIIQLIRDTTSVDASNPNSQFRKSMASSTTIEARR